MPEPSSINRSRITINVFLQLLALLVIFGLVNYLGFNHFRRWDFSRDQKYTLGDQTRRVLGQLEKPVEMIVYFSQASPIAFDTINLAREYVAHSDQKVHLEVINPYMGETRAHEVSRQNKLGDRENVVILRCEDRTRIINAETMAIFEPSFNPNEPPRLKAFTGEEVLTGALIAISEKAPNRLYILSGHGEPEFDGGNHHGLKTFLERQNIEIEPLKLTDVTVVPEDARMLMILAPRYDYGEREIEALSAYWKARGRLLIFLEPEFQTPRLHAFLSSLGVTVRPDRVLQTVPIDRTLTAVRKEITGDFMPGSPITERLANVTAVFMGTTQSLHLEPERVREANIRLVPLIEASEGFWGETRFDINTPEGIYFDVNEDVASPVVAASVEAGALADHHVQVDSSRLVVVGNAAFLSDQAMTTADLDFVLGGVNWLMARESLIGIVPKDVRNFSLNLSPEQLRNLALVVMGGIPGLAAFLGLIFWFRRRR